MSREACCPACGRAVGADDRFCAGCGARLAEGSATLRQLADRRSLHEVFAHLRSGEQRPVTILMTDISGFSTLGEYAEPEWLFHLLNEVLEELVQVLVAYGAHIDKYVGDEIVALFGAPIAQEKAVQRALRAALAMHERLRALNTRGRFGATNPSIHTGINVGPVMVGPVGPRSFADYTVIGDAVNVAKRLEDEAPAGEIFVSGAIQQAAADDFEFERIGALPLAGRQQPEEVYRVVGTRRAAEREEPEAFLPLIGRDTELSQLSQCAEQAASGAQTVAYIVGPAGMGKARLIEEYRRSMLDSQAPVPRSPIEAGVPVRAGARHLEARLRALLPAAFRTAATACHVFSEHFPLLPVADLVAQLGGLRIEGWPPRVGGDIEAAVRALPVDSESQDQLAELLRNLGLPAEEGDTGTHDALCETVTTLLQAVSGQGPLCLVLENVQWIDEASENILGRILRAGHRWPMLVILSAREPADRWPPEALQANTIRLAPLAPAVMERLIEAWAAPAIPSGAMRRAICDRAQGNPYFAREMVSACRSRGATPCAPTLTASSGELNLPYTLQELFLSQLDALPVPLRSLVQSASVVGEPMSYSMLEAAVGEDLPVTDALLRDAIGRGFLRTGMAPGQFVFARRLLFETAYETIPPSQRKSLHARVAAHMEQLLESMGEAAVHSAAHHAYLGYHDERAIELLLRSARLYRAQYANRQALKSANCVVELVGSLATAESFLDQRLEALLLVAQSHEVLGELSQAERTVAEAGLLAEDCRDAELVARIRTAGATLRLMQGEFADAEEEFRSARDAWQRLGNQPRVGHAILGMGLCAQQTGRRSEALELFVQAAEHGASESWVRAAAWNNAGIVLLGEGRYVEAEPYLWEGLRANEESGDRRGVAHSKASLGELCFRLARADEALSWLQAAVNEAADIEDAQCLELAGIYLARLHALEGRPEAARETLRALGPSQVPTDPEMASLRQVAELEAAMAQEGPDFGELSRAVSAPAPPESPASSNAYIEMLCVQVEAALRGTGGPPVYTGQRPVPLGRGEAAQAAAAVLSSCAAQAPDRHLRRYAQWLLGLVRSEGGRGKALSEKSGGEPTVFEIRSRRLITANDRMTNDRMTE